MAGIRGAEHLSSAELRAELQRGGRVVTFDFAVSLCVVSFARGTDAYFVRAGEGTFFKSLPYTLLSLTLGWWGLPFGPVFTIAAVWSNLAGGKDVTHRLLAPPGPPPPGRPEGGKSGWQRFKEEEGA